MTVLLEEFSPHGNLQAVVEEHENVVYFYLWAEEKSSFGVRSCWVRNLAEAPEVLDLESMEQGKAPLLPRAYCKHPQGAPPLVPSNLRVVWLEEGDGAALLDDGEIICVIPAWSGEEGFHGYALHCLGDSPLCWELEADNAMHKRVAAADSFWNEWDNGAESWKDVQTSSLAAVETAIGPLQRYFAIDGDYWPPKAVVELKGQGATVLVSIGVGIRPQPQVEMYFDNPSEWRRIEFGIAVADEIANEELVTKLCSYISAISKSPWDDFSWFGHGHTVACDIFPGYPALICCLDPAGVPDFSMPKYREDPVKILWLLPITEDELEIAREEGSQPVFTALAKENDNFWIHKR